MGHHRLRGCLCRASGIWRNGHSIRCIWANGIAPLAAFIFSYNYILAWGFLSYLFSVGFCLLLFAGWIAAAKWHRWLRVLLFSIAALALYFCHIFGFASYCILVGGYEVARAWRDRPSPKTVAMDWLAAASQSLPAIALWVFYDRSALFEGTVQTNYGGLNEKFTALRSPAIFIGGWIDDTVFIVFVLFLVLGAFLKQIIRVDSRIWPSLAALSVIAIAMPNWLFGVWGTDFRLPLIIVMVLVGGLSLRMGRSVSCIFVVVVGALLAAKSISALLAFQGAEIVLNDTRSVVAEIPRGAQILVVESRGPEITKRGDVPCSVEKGEAGMVGLRG